MARETTMAANAGGPAGAPAPASTAHGASLLDAVIDAAPDLVRQRHLLPAADWRQASEAQVARLCQRLEEARLRLPPWLARDLALAGHRLTDTALANAAADLRLLNAVNALPEGEPPADALAAELRHAAASGLLAHDIATAIADRLAARGADALACEIALGSWPSAPQALNRLRRQFSAYVATLPPMAVRIAGLATTAPLAEALVPALAARGRRAEVTQAPFAALVAELLTPRETSEPLVVMLDPLSLGEADWRNGLDAHAADREAKLDALIQALDSFAARAHAPLLVTSPPYFADPALGHLDAAHAAGRAAWLRRVDTALAELAARRPAVHLVDGEQALAAIAPAERSDPRLWFYGRIPYGEGATRALATAIATTLAARSATPVKVVALDFDNTLWGGVYGDDGIERLQCGDDAPGNAFKAFQAECLRLKAQGKLLVALSKNNADAITVFARHPGMALQADDFAATAIDWQPKPDNIRRLAKELNLGLDAILFLDDSPHEREAMRRMCPQVRVPELPADPAARPVWLRRLAETWPLRLTAEDTERSAMYLAERQARSLRETASSYDDYLAALGQELQIAPMTPATLARVAQLHERTNQFNLTTRRFSESDLAAFMAAPATALVLTGTAADRFGSHGLVLAAVARVEGTRASIESLLMSCRVIARQVETAFLGALLAELIARGVSEVSGHYRPTAKNAMVRDLYAQHGFEPVRSDDSASEWVWRSGSHPLPASPYVRITGSTR